MTSRWLRRAAFLLCAALLAQSGVLAHHSGAMFDTAHPLTLTGTVKEFRWVNPHAILLIETAARPGEAAVLWAVEMSSPGNMTRMGWSRTTVRVNQAVEVTVSPMRDGSHGGGCQRVKLVETGQSVECGAVAAIRAGEKANLP